MKRTMRDLLSHPSLKVSLAATAAVLVLRLLSLLPYYGVCTVGHIRTFAFLEIGVVLLAGLALVSWTTVSFIVFVKDRSNRTPFVATLVASTLLFLGEIAHISVGASVRTFAIERFTERMRPTIDAISAHVERRGSPPAEREVAPLPDDGLCAEGDLHYGRDGDSWTLSLTVQQSSTHAERLTYRSTEALKYGEKDVEGWRWLTIFE